MFTSKFLDQIAVGVAQKWIERLFNPALVFWIGGILAFVSAHGAAPLITSTQALDMPLHIALAVGGLLVAVYGLMAMVKSVEFYALRILEGYWPGILQPLRSYFVKVQAKRQAGKRLEWERLAVRFVDLSSEERERYARLDADLAAYPSRNRLLPTRLGNWLRAAEDYGWRRYGLATSVVWPRLWGVMPDTAKKEIVEARKRLDDAVGTFVYSVLFLAWTPWAWYWVVPSAFLGMLWAYGQAIQSAGVYGELLRAAFDLYRVLLYKALRWPLPLNPAEEEQVGRRLTYFLQRGSRGKTPYFIES